MERFVAIKAVVNGRLVPTFIIDRKLTDTLTMDKLTSMVDEIVNPRGMFTVDIIHITPVNEQLAKALAAEG